MSDQPDVEVRFMAPADHVAIVAAMVQARPGSDRGDVMRRILAEAVQQKIHEATLITRVARYNGNALESGRQLNGNRYVQDADFANQVIEAAMASPYLVKLPESERRSKLKLLQAVLGVEE